MRRDGTTPMGVKSFGLFFKKTNAEQICGHISDPGKRDKIPFTSLAEMFLLVDALLDYESALDVPYFVESQEDSQFQLEVMSRQKSSWQGRLRQIENGNIFSFHSELELLIILESLLV